MMLQPTPPPNAEHSPRQEKKQIYGIFLSYISTFRFRSFPKLSINLH
jgi:hypothetical protein